MKTKLRSVNGDNNRRAFSHEPPRITNLPQLNITDHFIYIFGDFNRLLQSFQFVKHS